MVKRVASEAHSRESGAADRLAGGIGDVQQRDARGAGDRWSHPVHRVRAEHDAVRASALELTRRLRHLFAEHAPVTAVLQRFDLAEVDSQHEAAYGVVTAESLLARLGDEAIVFGGGFPAHAADETDGLHVAWDQSRTYRGDGLTALSAVRAPPSCTAFAGRCRPRRTSPSACDTPRRCRCASNSDSAREGRRVQHLDAAEVEAFAVDDLRVVVRGHARRASSPGSSSRD